MELGSIENLASEVSSIETSLETNYLKVSKGTTANRPATLDTDDAGKVAYYDTDTQGFVIWTGTKWSDQ